MITENVANLPTNELLIQLKSMNINNEITNLNNDINKLSSTIIYNTNLRNAWKQFGDAINGMIGGSAGDHNLLRNMLNCEPLCDIIIPFMQANGYWGWNKGDARRNNLGNFSLGISTNNYNSKIIPTSPDQLQLLRLLQKRHLLQSLKYPLYKSNIWEIDPIINLNNFIIQTIYGYQYKLYDVTYCLNLNKNKLKIDNENYLYKTDGYNYICPSLNDKSCIKVNNINIDKYELLINREFPLVQYVKITLTQNSWLSLGEVEVYDNKGINVAKGKATSQSSTLNSNYPSSNAVDGNFQSFTHTGPQQGAGQWWQVDLGNNYEINQIQIYNRRDCCPERLNSSKVELLSSSNGIIQSWTISGDYLNILNVNPTPSNNIYDINCIQSDQTKTKSNSNIEPANFCKTKFDYYNLYPSTNPLVIRGKNINQAIPNTINNDITLNNLASKYRNFIPQIYTPQDIKNGINTLMENAPIKLACCGRTNNTNNSELKLNTRVPLNPDIAKKSPLYNSFNFQPEIITIPPNSCPANLTPNSTDCNAFFGVYCENVINTFNEQKLPQTEFIKYAPECACYVPKTPEQKYYPAGAPSICYKDGCTQNSISYLDETSQGPNAKCDMTICQNIVNTAGLTAGGNANITPTLQNQCGQYIPPEPKPEPKIEPKIKPKPESNSSPDTASQSSPDTASQSSPDTTSQSSPDTSSTNIIIITIIIIFLLLCSSSIYFITKKK
jgi:hypothetical protein